MRKTLIAIVAVAAMCTIAIYAQAASCTGAEKASAESAAKAVAPAATPEAQSAATTLPVGAAVEAPKVVDVGNTICPVEGATIDQAKKATFEYEGKVYSFCCANCIEEFKKDPAKYIAKAEEEMKAKAAAAAPAAAVEKK